MENGLNDWKNNMENIPEPAFNEQDWSDMEKRLGKKEKKNAPGFLWFWVTLPLLAMLLGSNFYWLKRVADKPAPHTMAFSTTHDTVYITKIEKTTDTIYLTKWLTPKPQKQFADFENPIALTNQTFFQTQTNETVLKGYGSPENQSNDILHLGDISRQTLSFHPLDFKKLEAIAWDENLNFQTGNFKQEERKQMQFRQFLYTIRPRDWEVGTSVGGIMPFAKGLNSNGGVATGLQVLLGVSDRLKVKLEGNFYNQNVTSSEFNPAKGFPEVTPPSDDLFFTGAEASQSFLEVNIGMDYYFKKEFQKFYPGLGLSYGATKFLPYEANYDFENTNLGLIWNAEQKIDRNVWVNNFLTAKASLNYQLNKKWRANIETGFRYHLENEAYRMPALIGLKGGIFWKFL